MKSDIEIPMLRSEYGEPKSSSNGYQSVAITNFAYNDLQVQVPEVQNAWEYEQYECPTDVSSEPPHTTSVQRLRRTNARPSLNTPQGFDTSEDELTSTAFDVPRKRGRRRGGRPSQATEDYELESETSDSSNENFNVVNSRQKSTKQLGRSRRSINVTKPDYREIWDLDNSDDRSDLVLGKRKRGQPSHTSQSRKGATRHSARSRRSVNMREYRYDDETEAVDRKVPGPPKAVGAKEHFVELANNNPFRLCHNQMCHTCEESGDNDEKGSLIFCQGCTFSYHRRCLGNRNIRDHLVTKVAKDSFVLQCRRCVEIAVVKNPHASKQGRCQACYQPGAMCAPLRKKQSSKEEQRAREENNGEDPITEVPQEQLNKKLNVLFRCISCCRAFHVHHLTSQVGNLDPLIDQDPGDSLPETNAEDLYDIRLAQHRQTWRCGECSSSPAEIDALVAWRPADTKLHYTQNLRYHDFNEDDKDYLIKWKGLSYSQCSWLPGSWVWGIASPIMRKTFAKREKPATFTAEDAIPEEYLRIDIILDVEYTSVVKMRVEAVDKARLKEVERVLVKFKGLGYEDAAWEKPPRENEPERWSDYTAAYDDWVLGRHTHLPKLGPLKAHLEQIRSQYFKAVELSSQPKNLTGGKLMEYQMEGVNWLYYKWHSMQNAILADEMGLGKTIQIVGLLATLQQRHGCWPFLIVVPNSTCPNWRREIKQWAPSLRVVTYFGSSEAKRLAVKHELFPEGSRDLHCHVVVTSYDAAEDMNFRTVFRGVPWAGLIVDEGQRLKSDKNILYSALGSLNIPFKVLLTGTPLQNNQRELFNLLQFLDKSIDAAALEEEYEDLNREAIIEIHSLLRPFFLRRTKAQVLRHLPPMAQIIIPVTMTVVQKKLYKSILAKNQELIKAIFGGSQKLKQTDKSNLNNILMQLRKCLCHPFVYNREIEEKTENLALSHRNLVEASAKLRLLEIMLPKLQERGHRVLIFSQFLDMLDMVEDFLDGLGMFYQRLDGNMNSLQKQKRIDEYNAPGSTLFAFLLSTRAGGVGINLASADTVIILDPDFNPHQDIQALSRAHRIGQEKKVLVFQLTTRNSVEEKIMQIGKKKMSLDHVLIDQMDDDEDENVDLETILRHGAEALFQEEAADISYDSTSVDKLLDRSSKEDTETGNNASADTQFSFARVWANDKGDMGGDLGDEGTEARPVDPSLWDKILKEREEEVALEAAARAEALGRGKRRRTNVDYTREMIEDDGLELEASPAKPGRGRKPKEGSESDTDFQARPEAPESDDSDLDHQMPDSELQEPTKPQKSRSQILKPTQDRAFRRAELPSPNRPLKKTLNLLPKSPRSAIDGAESVASNMTPGFPLPTAIPSQQYPQSHPIASTQPVAPCLACDAHHHVGYCPLKLAGVEFCGLCGLAHFGHARTCPHLTSVTQCRQMLESLRQSQEPPHLVEMARKYVVGVIGDLRRRKKEEKIRRERAALDELPGGPSMTAPLNGNTAEARVATGYGPNGQPKSLYANVKGNLYITRPDTVINGVPGVTENGESDGFKKIANGLQVGQANGDERE